MATTEKGPGSAPGTFPALRWGYWTCTTRSMTPLATTPATPERRFGPLLPAPAVPAYVDAGTALVRGSLPRLCSEFIGLA